MPPDLRWRTHARRRRDRPAPSSRRACVRHRRSGGIYSLFGALIFSGYIIFDTFLITQKLGYDDHILAAVTLYRRRRGSRIPPAVRLPAASPRPLRGVNATAPRRRRDRPAAAPRPS